ncbi:aromatase/cyclase [Saccharothrix syringae]|uniref:Cyclase n=1 Tax=Saccharothrix syringae TaxID=103733 RepID=A0A5Q0H5F0_SACSY|nr:aromatase/cyclase [Saccharothrix syringae]QFZ21427.1 cyclase [Saccharothrix syringae]
MTTSLAREVEHDITVRASARAVYDLIADVADWPQVFPPTVHVEHLERGETGERIRIWATANGTAKTWTSRRELDPGRLRVEFRQEVSQAPVGAMGGCWLVEPLSADECRVRLLHDYRPVDDDPEKLAWIEAAVDRNSHAELAALKATAEGAHDGLLFGFADSVEVDGHARDVFDFINEADRWSERLPHVARVRLEEDTPGLQLLDMDTRTKDGKTHTTTSVRVCLAPTTIVYKQIRVPALMTLHTGRWQIDQRPGGGLVVTSRHTVRINEDNITSVLGPGADVPAAREFVQKALSANSLATLGHAKTYAERRA